MTSIIQWLIELLRSLRLWVTILPWERAVRVRFGKRAEVLDPGVHFCYPYIDKIWPVNQRLRFSNFPVQSLTTKDGKILNVAGMIKFKIVDPLVAMQALMDPENSVAAICMTVVSDYILGRNLTDLDPLELEALAMSQLILHAPGFEFESVSMTDWATGRSIRLMNDSWRPDTKSDKDPYDNK